MLVNVFNFMDPQEPQKLSGESFFETAETGDGNDLGREEMETETRADVSDARVHEHILATWTTNLRRRLSVADHFHQLRLQKLRRVWRRSDSSPHPVAELRIKKLKRVGFTREIDGKRVEVVPRFIRALCLVCL